MMNDNQLDQLLNAPLAAVADSGFSARVIARARKVRRKENVPFFAAALVCVAAMLIFVPLLRVTTVIAHFLTGMAASPAISLAIGALVLTFTAERALAQR